MKRLFFIVLLCAGFYSVNAQTISLTAGPTFSKFRYENNWYNNYYFDKTHTGIFARLGIEYFKKKCFSINSSVSFVNAGGSGDHWIQESGHFKTRSSVNMISINSSLRLKFPLSEKITFWAGAGPRIDFVVGYTETDNFLSSFDYYNGIEPFLYGGLAEIGVVYKKDKYQLGMMLNYCFNKNQLVEYTSPYLSSHHDNVWMNYFSLGFSVGFDL